jgi:hypothetical protein
LGVKGWAEEISNEIYSNSQFMV